MGWILKIFAVLVGVFYDVYGHQDGKTEKNE